MVAASTMSAAVTLAGDDGPVESIPVELFLSAYPEPMQAIAQRLRKIVRRATPDAIEAVRAGWHLIGYDLPVGRRTVYFCYVAPEPEHVHLGFEYGTFMDDPDGRLVGAGITRKVRWVTLRPSDAIDELALAALVREAARVAALSPSERVASVLDREIAPA
jgi:hypothetical protein